MTTKLEQAEAIITKVEQMRRWQKEYFNHRDALALRKAKELESEIDRLLKKSWRRCRKRQKRSLPNVTA